MVIARALANAPEILLCDEATSALDPQTTKQILDLLKRVAEELGVTLVVITHEMEVIKAICNKVAILESGKVIEQGHTIDVFTKSTREETRHFIGEIECSDTLPVKGHRLLLIFAKGSANSPILSQVIQTFGVDINILSGQIESIQGHAVGKLLIDVASDLTTLSAIRKSLHEQNVISEVL